MTTKHKLAVWLGALAALAISTASASAVEGKLPNGGAFSAKTIWTDQADLTEIARFPLRSTNPSFIVYVESLHPELSPCTREQTWSGECIRPNLCEIFVDVRDDLQPVRTEPIQPDPSRVLIAWTNEEIREGNGLHTLPHWDFGVLLVAGGASAETLWFHGPIILDYADGNQQCMAGVRVEYAVNAKNLFNKWRP
jgi:hypothetical protein